MAEDDAPHITIVTNGPYLVSGGLPLAERALTVDESGNTWDYEPLRELDVPASYALCRCGHSQNKPFCDGSHARAGFDGDEPADRRSLVEQSKRIDGPTIELEDAPALCAFARICDGHGRIWDTVGEAEDAESREVVIHQAAYCPSGRLVARDKLARGEAAELPHVPSVVLLEDPQEDVSGPIWVRGGVRVTGADGKDYERRNRVTLCRCGQSSNKPFCDGTHAHIGFKARA